MGRRGEPRIAVTFPVIVRGLDSRGTPFVLTAETRDISCTGACLKGLSGIVVSGKKVEVEYGDQRAWFRVQWAGAAGSSKAGQAGLRCLEPGKYIWGIPPKEWEADSFDPSRPEATIQRPPPPTVSPSASGPWSGHERRQFVRHACRMAAQIVLQNGGLRMTATVTDISLGGCYMEMLSPLPVDTFVDVSISPGDTTLQLSARVRSSQLNLGMGVSFTGMRPQDFEVLRKLAPPTIGALEPPAQAAPSAQPAPLPPAPAKGSPSYTAVDFGSVDLPTNPEAVAAAVRVLIRKGVLTRAEVMEELEKLKVPHS